MKLIFTALDPLADLLRVICGLFPLASDVRLDPAAAPGNSLDDMAGFPAAVPTLLYDGGLYIAPQ